MEDVIIIGGAFAGLAAALQLGRARRKVTVLDTGLQRKQLSRYPTIRMVDARAENISGAINDFSVLTDSGESFAARRAILSYGVVDQMPDIPGFAESWGTFIIPCPYCDGFEVAGQHWGLVWSGPQSHNQARLFLDWTDTLTVLPDAHEIAPDIRAELDRRGISVVDGRIIEIAHSGHHGAVVMLDAGSNDPLHQIPGPNS